MDTNNNQQTQIILNVPAQSKRNPHALYCEEPSLTVQAEKDQCDINQIIARYSRGADVTHVNERVARYGDFSNVPDYQSSLDLINRANGFFMEMSPEIRERFQNDPAQMIAFLQDPKNTDEAIKLGLAVPKKVEAPAVPPEVPVDPKGSTTPTPAPFTAPGK